MQPYARRVRWVLLVALVLNVAVAVGKLVAGYRAQSLAVVADGLHSGMDALANAIALFVIAYASRPADEDHPFGHGRYETLAAFVVSGLLLLTAFEVGRSAIERLLHPVPMGVSFLTVAVVLATLVVNLGVTWFETREGRRLGSEVLLADAAQTRADVFVSMGVLVGLLLERSGLALDAWVALAVAGTIAWSAYRVFRDVAPILTDKAVLDPAEVARVVRGVPGVESVHDIRSRGSRRDVHVQMHLVVHARDVQGAHAIADEVEKRLERELGVKEAVVHIEPEDDRSGPPGSRPDAS
jgi:cation diffusion facilitator family transporter